MTESIREQAERMNETLFNGQLTIAIHQKLIDELTKRHIAGAAEQRGDVYITDHAPECCPDHDIPLVVYKGKGICTICAAHSDDTGE